MDLSDYIKQNDISIAKMARSMGYQENYLTNIVNKRRRAGRSLAKAIQTYTKGAVKEKDMLGLKIVSAKEEKALFEQWKKEKATTE
jgi:hypothetical protein